MIRNMRGAICLYCWRLPCPARSGTQSDPISVISRSQAIGIATDSDCRHFKSDCYYHTYLVATTDGGRTWQPL